MIRYDPADLKRVKALIKKECCNYDSGNCVLLDDGETCVCPQTISYSLLCKWFRNAVLPLDNDVHKTDAPEKHQNLRDLRQRV